MYVYALLVVLPPHRILLPESAADVGTFFVNDSALFCGCPGGAYLPYEISQTCGCWHSYCIRRNNKKLKKEEKDNMNDMFEK